MKWIEKFLKIKIPEEWNDENGLFFNLMNLLFWAIIIGIMLFLFSVFGG